MLCFASDEEIFPSNIRQDYCIMIDQLTIVLDSILELQTIDQSTIILLRVITQNFYSLTMTNDLRTYIKSKPIIPLLFKSKDIGDDIVQFHVYRILASILTEDDIKALTDSSKIAGVFLRFLTDLIDDSSMIPRFHNLMRSLNGKIQSCHL